MVGYIPPFWFFTHLWSLEDSPWPVECGPNLRIRLSVVYLMFIIRYDELSRTIRAAQFIEVTSHIHAWIHETGNVKLKEPAF